MKRKRGKEVKTKNKKTIYPKKANPSPGTGPEKGMRLGLKKEGGDLLSRLRSTSGAVGLNFSVRNGKRWNTNAIATRMGDMTDNPDASDNPHRESHGHVSR